jgi:hypothetical protein
MKSAKMIFRSRPWTMKTTSSLSTDEEPDIKRTNQAVNHEEDTLPDEEVINQDLDQKEEEARVVETT